MSILPIPSDYTLSQEWNFDTLYCCDKYRQLIEETKRATAAAEVEFELMHLLIDTRSKNRKLTGEALPRYSVGGKKKNAIQIIAATALANMENEKTHDKCVDTQDLPWDPTETHLQYASQRLGYEDQPSPPKTSLKDMNILLELEEVYTNRATQSPPAENKALPGNVSQNSVGI
ncbi:hypothetical protein EGW08_003624 [Elysia chlorotica]|uniref:Uncharacterized protein n=1 Tax=Elysia chlorotica TaxID=188477 RepID=A0A433U487_ELYCH|nr:hypothetical protein EGW08_003624 [Elysia chlorotica]